jgi:Mrp family chromosome partitioning ATPase
MSRNFALLRIVGKEEEYFQSQGGTSAPRLAAVLPAPTPNGFSPSDSVERLAITQPVGDLQPLRFEMEEWQREELNKLVYGIFLAPGAESNRMVVLASAESGNGCSWICARAAELLASQVAGRVCLVDANFASPTLHEHFGVSNHHGLSESLQQEESIGGYVSQLSRQNLALVSAGRDISSCLREEHFPWERLSLRLGQLRAEFDYILIDGASLDLGDASIALAGMADGMVIVLKTDSTRKERTRSRVQVLKSAGVRILGAVLNQPAC